MTTKKTGSNVYTFGDSERAAERLYWLASTFESSTLAFATEACRTPPRTCVDLGAGPGFLSAALHHALSAHETIGLEASPNFVAYGAPHLPAGVTLRVHDVTTPLPVSADVLVARFLLTHLRAPEAALRTWCASSRRGALVLLEELVSMRSETPELTTYYELVAAVQRAAGQDMHVGSALPELARAAGLTEHQGDSVELHLPERTMTRLHALNLPTLRLQPVVRERYDDASLDHLQGWLEARASLTNGDAIVRVTMARCAARVT